MSKFPNMITPPDSISEARAERKRHLQTTIGWGVTIRSMIILMELAGVVFFGSTTLFMDALSSTLDVLCSLCLLFFIKLAERPPDRNHPFGHGRFEPLAGMQLSILLIVVGISMLIQQALQIGHLTSEQLDGHVWIIPLCAVIALETCYAISMRAARKHNSPALAAEAYHYRIDSLTSIFATVALAFAAYFPEWSMTIDHLGAMAIALLMICLGAYSMRDNLHQLMDRVPAQHYFDTVRKASKNVPGVLDTEKIRIQLYGPDAHVDIDVEVEPDLSVEKAHEISQQVRIVIQKEWPAVRDVTVHIEPYYPNDH